MSDEGKRTTWTAIGSLGLGTVIAWFAFQWMMKSTDSDRAFIQGEFLQAIKANTSASTEVKVAITQFASQADRQIDALNDLVDSHQTLADRVNKLISDEWQKQQATSPQ